MRFKVWYRVHTLIFAKNKPVPTDRIEGSTWCRYTEAADRYEAADKVSKELREERRDTRRKAYDIEICDVEEVAA